MNKDLEIQYKAETGSKPECFVVDSTWIGHGNCHIHAIPIKEIPAQFREYDTETDTWHIIWPSTDYINWLEEKIIELRPQIQHSSFQTQNS